MWPYLCTNSHHKISQDRTIMLYICMNVAKGTFAIYTASGNITYVAIHVFHHLNCTVIYRCQFSCAALSVNNLHWQCSILGFFTTALTVPVMAFMERSSYSSSAAFIRLAEIPLTIKTEQLRSTRYRYICSTASLPLLRFYGDQSVTLLPAICSQILWLSPKFFP